jgi:DNA-binding beta-propeller fold protein YncE
MKLTTRALAVLALLTGGFGQARGGFVFWADSANVNTVGIWRSNLDGSGATQLIDGYPPQVNIPFGVAVDSASGQLYWTDYGNSTIQRSNLDGTGITTLVTGADGPFALTLDLAGGKMYWFNRSISSTLYTLNSANLDGTGVQTLLTASDGVHELAVFNPVPEPASFLSLAIGCASVGAYAWLRRKQKPVPGSPLLQVRP